MWGSIGSSLVLPVGSRMGGGFNVEVDNVEYAALGEHEPFRSRPHLALADACSFVLSWVDWCSFVGFVVWLRSPQSAEGENRRHTA